MAPALRVDMLDAIIPIAKNATDRLAKRLSQYKNTAAPVDMFEEIRLLTLQVIGEAILSLGADECDRVGGVGGWAGEARGLRVPLGLQWAGTGVQGWGRVAAVRGAGQGHRRMWELAAEASLWRVDKPGSLEAVGYMAAAGTRPLLGGGWGFQQVGPPALLGHAAGAARGGPAPPSCADSPGTSCPAAPQVFPHLYLPVMEESNRRVLQPWRYLYPGTVMQYNARVRQLDTYLLCIIRERWAARRKGQVPEKGDILDRILQNIEVRGEGARGLVRGCGHVAGAAWQQRTGCIETAWGCSRSLHGAPGRPGTLHTHSTAVPGCAWQQAGGSALGPAGAAPRGLPSLQAGARPPLTLALLTKRTAALPTAQERGEPWSAATEKQLCFEMKTFLLAGHETSSAMLAWTLYELSQSKEKMLRVGGWVGRGWVGCRRAGLAEWA